MKNIVANLDNLGGLISVYAVPPASFDKIRIDYTEHTKTVEFVRYDDIIEIPVLPDSDYQFFELCEDTEAGTGYKVSVEGVIPRIAKVNEDVIEELERGEWYVLAVDQNGVSHWCGHEDSLMHFTSSNRTGATSASRNATEFTFECLQAVKTSIVTNDVI